MKTWTDAMKRRCIAYLIAAAAIFGPLELRGDELPLPEVPQSLTLPAERADYIMAHFWDSLEVADTLRRHNREFMELNIVNFMSLFPHGSDTGCSHAIAHLLAESAADETSLRVVTEIFDRYLDSRDSPMRSEKHYLLYIEELLRLPQLPEDLRARNSYRLTMAGKNRPGSVATDFAYIDRDGIRRTLHTTAPGRPLTLVFYDPECDRCNALLDELRDTAEEVLVVYPGDDRRLWESTKAALPQRWTVGIDATGIIEGELYYLAELPVIYRLTADKRVSKR